MELLIKNIPDTPNVRETGVTDSDDYEKKIESMAEDLAGRMTRFHKRLGALRLSGVSQREKTKIQTWADKEEDELHRLRETIRKRKRSYVKTIPNHHLVRLGNHHPVWKTHYDMYMDQIQRTTITHEEERPVIRCTVMPYVLNSLMIFREAGEGTVLCVNSDRGLRYEEGEPGGKDGVRWMPLNDTFSPLRRNMIRMVERIRSSGYSPMICGVSMTISSGLLSVLRHNPLPLLFLWFLWW